MPGDALFEACYLSEFREVARTLRDDYDGSYERFWEDFRSRPSLSKASDDFLLNSWCMAACYSTDPDGTVRLPFDVDTGELVPDVWERWLAWDPVRMAPERAEALRSLKAIYVDAGKRDEYYLDLGAEAFRRALADIGVTDVHFELFDATHMAIEYRYPLSLAYLADGSRPRPARRRARRGARARSSCAELRVAADRPAVDEDLRHRPADRSSP